MLKLTTFSPMQNLLFSYYPTGEIKQISFTNGTMTKYAYYSPSGVRSIWRAIHWPASRICRKPRKPQVASEGIILTESPGGYTGAQET